jgi:uncharacterized heparinase superfamily protein
LSTGDVQRRPIGSVISRSIGGDLVCAGGLQRIEALAGLLVGHLSISGYERHLEPVGQAFAAELNKQILPDGGHVTRNPMALVELLLDFLPLRQCFITREQKLPEGFDDTIKRMLKMLRYLRPAMRSAGSMACRRT